MRVHFHQALASMQSQYCNDVCNIALIEKNGVTPKCIATPFCSDSTCFHWFQWELCCKRHYTVDADTWCKQSPRQNIVPLRYNFRQSGIWTWKLYFLTSFAGCTSRCPYRHTVFFLGSEPSCPSNTGGSGICFPSGSVCFPTSHSSVVPPSFSISCNNKYAGTLVKLKEKSPCRTEVVRHLL